MSDTYKPPELGLWLAHFWTSAFIVIRSWGEMFIEHLRGLWIDLPRAGEYPVTYPLAVVATVGLIALIGVGLVATIQGSWIPTLIIGAFLFFCALVRQVWSHYDPH